MDPPAELKDYKGNCHCGLFKFTLSIPELKSVRVCQCSFCSRKAMMWVFPASNLKIQNGEDEVSTYQFGKREMLHSFCPKCGNAVLGKHLPSGAQGINARLLQSIDLTSLQQTMFKGTSGAEYGPPYTPPSTYPSPSTAQNVETLDASEELDVFHGNCHCGTIAYTLVSKPLSERKVISCNCSLCSRNGEIYTYPPASSVTFIGKEYLTGYPFLSPDSLHSFCRICGTSVCVQVLKEGEDLMPLNLNTLCGVDVAELEVTEYDGAKNDPQYVVA